MQKKILAFTNLFPRNWEPHRATFNRQQFSEIAKYFHIEVLVPVAWTVILIAWRNKQLSLTQKEWHTVKATYFPYFFVPRVARWSYGITLFLSSILVLPKFLGPQRPHLIFATWAYPDAFAAVCLGWLFNIPVVVKVHGSDINEQPEITGVGRQVAWVLKHAKGVVSVSNDLAKKVIALGAERNKVRVIYNGVDASLFYPIDQQKCRKKLSLDQDTRVILYVGNLKASKGCLDLIDAFAMFKDENGIADLIIIGSGPCEAAIQTKIEQLGLTRCVHLAGQQKHELLPTWMGAADLIVLPSHAEGVPNVLLEAMACGKPIVATNIGGIPEIVPDDCGILVEPKQVMQLAHAIKDVLEKPWNTKAIVTYASNYVWEKNVKLISAMFLELI